MSSHHRFEEISKGGRSVMEQIEQYIEVIRNTHGLLAPLLFILLHAIRPLLFIPVILVFIAGGLIFGLVPGMILSIIGAVLSSVLFYLITQCLPRFTNRLRKMKNKVIGEDRHVTTGQVAVLRLIPFIHYHLLSFLLYEASDNFYAYLESSFYTAIPMTIAYTFIGQAIISFSPVMIGIFIICLIPLLFVFRKKETGVSVREFLR